jgi:hypothetical protein
MTFHFGGLAIPPYRLVTLIFFFPAAAKWAGFPKKYACDYLLISFSAWAAMSVFVNGGLPDAIAPAGSLFLDTFGSYVIARAYIRSTNEFTSIVWTLFLMILGLIPLAVYESLTSHPVILETLQHIGDTYKIIPPSPRFHLFRAQTVFEHSIHHGMFCATAVGLSFFCIGSGRLSAKSAARSCLATFAAAFSLSSGALLAAQTQYFLIIWDRMTRKINRRWVVLAVLFAFAFVSVDVLSNRGTFKVLASTLAFNSSSSYNRVLIFQYGGAEVLRHPLFGIGFGDWERPAWMGSSVDNFWLLIALHYGLPSLAFFVAAIFTILVSLGRLKREDFDRYRNGLVISLMGFIVGGVTVDYWGVTYSYFIFLLGSGLWMRDSTENRRLVMPQGGQREIRATPMIPPGSRIHSSPLSSSATGDRVAPSTQIGSTNASRR